MDMDIKAVRDGKLMYRLEGVWLPIVVALCHLKEQGFGIHEALCYLIGLENQNDGTV